jgi:cyclase
MRITTASLLLLALAGTGACAGLTKLADGVWFREGAKDPTGPGAECNHLLIEMEDYSIVVDGNFPDGARSAMADFRKVSNKPIRYVFNTHHHGDHAYGNIVWKQAGATILARAAVVQEMNRYEPKRFEETQRGMASLTVLQRPTQTFEEDLFVLEDATRRVEFRSFGYAHTRGDGFVYLPKEKILCTGDVVVNGPYTWTGDSFMENWPKVIAKAMELDIDRVVPGHGPLGGKELMERQRDFLMWIWTAAGQKKRKLLFPPELKVMFGDEGRTQQQLDDAAWEIKHHQPCGDQKPDSRM